LEVALSALSKVQGDLFPQGTKFHMEIFEESGRKMTPVAGREVKKPAMKAGFQLG